MDLSICIVNWNVREDLARCLESLPEAAAGLEYEVIVVDNASTDGSLELLRSRFGEVSVIANGCNRGFAAANVQALAQARGRWLLLLNPDTVAPPESLAELVRFGDEHPRAGVVGPKLVHGDGSLQPSCRRFPTLCAAVLRNTVLGRLCPGARWSADYLMEEWDHQSVRIVDWVSGACMMVRRQAFEQVGTLDEGFYWGSEDVDYCWRMGKAGWEVLYTPQPVITHFVGHSTSQVQVKTILRTHRGMYRLYRKHLGRNPLARGLVWLGVWLRAGLLLAQYAAHRGLDGVHRLRMRVGGAEVGR